MIITFGNPNKFAINIKILNNSTMYHDCTFSIVVGGYEVGELNEKISTWDFIECNNMSIDIDEFLNSLDKLYDFSTSFGNYSGKEMIEKVLYKVYCDQENTDEQIFNSVLFVEHDSMHNYFILLIRKKNKFYFASAKRGEIKDISKNCINKNFQVSDCNIQLIDIEETKNILKQVQNFLRNL